MSPLVTESSGLGGFSGAADLARERVACLGWSRRAWLQPWLDFLAAHPGLQKRNALEVGAGARSSLAPLLLGVAEQVECSVFERAELPAVQAHNDRILSAQEKHRVCYSQQDVRQPQGEWDLIVLKSVLGGVYRTNDSSLSDVADTVHRLVDRHLTPGGMLITLDNGRTAFEPFLARTGARRNSWRFFRSTDLPTAQERYSFGVLSVASAATRLGRLGTHIDDVLYHADRALSPLTTERAVHLSVYRKSA